MIAARNEFECTCATSMTGFCPVHGQINYSETTYSRFHGWRDEHGAKVSPPPKHLCRYCWQGHCEYHGDAA